MNTWRKKGACAGHDPTLWFPEGNGPADTDYNKARVICLRCPVRAECLDHAMNFPEAWGMWGGKTPRERGQNEEPEPEPGTVRCAGCYKLIEKKGNQKYCSSACYNQLRNRIRIAERNVRRIAGKLDRQKRPCAECGRAFTPSRIDHKFCSEFCQQKAHKGRFSQTEESCALCGASFTKTHPSKKFCSSRCQQRHRDRTRYQRLKLSSA